MPRPPHPRPSRARELVYTMRLARAERRLIEAAAIRRGEYMSEFVRRTCAEAARRELADESS